MKRAKRIALLRIDVRMKVELPVKYMQDTWALNFAFLPTQDYKIQSFFGYRKSFHNILTCYWIGFFELIGKVIYTGFETV